MPGANVAQEPESASGTQVPEPMWDRGTGLSHERSPTSRGFRGLMSRRTQMRRPQRPLACASSLSGRPDSNWRPSPWQGDALPLSHARNSLSTEPFQVMVPTGCCQDSTFIPHRQMARGQLLMLLPMVATPTEVIRRPHAIWEPRYRPRGCRARPTGAKSKLFRLSPPGIDKCL